MNILITGGTGYIGQRLCQQLLAQEHKVFVFTRHLSRGKKRCPGAILVTEFKALDDEDIDVIINLAGAPIAAKRWSAKRKQTLIASRVSFTESMFNYFQGRDQHPKTVVSASAIGFYGDQGNKSLTEESAGQDEFTHQLCRDWEQAAKAFSALGSQVSCMRLGVVIGYNSGFIKQLYWPYQFGMGGRIGSGQQWLSWVSIDDVLAVFKQAINGEYPEIVNLVSPNPVRNREFSRAFGKALKRPTLLPLPSWFVRLVFGEMSQLLLTGQKVMPQILQKNSYQFVHANIEDALKAALKAS